MADPPVYAFRKVDLACSEPNNRPKKKKVSAAAYTLSWKITMSFHSSSCYPGLVKLCKAEGSKSGKTLGTPQTNSSKSRIFQPEEGTREVENLSKEAEAGKEKGDHVEEIEEKSKAANRSEQVESEANDLFLKGPLNIQRELSMVGSLFKCGPKLKVVFSSNMWSST